MSEQRVNHLNETFAEVFGSKPESHVYRAPGRVNLIGEHTDYNGGLVLPIAIDLDTHVLIGRTKEDVVRLYSTNLEGGGLIKLDELHERQGKWTDYVQGLLVELDSRGDVLGGFDLLVDSQVPVGGGLSSSAALEVGVMGALMDLFNLKLDDYEIINSCRRAENDFVGASTGIMDQYISYYGQAGSALLLNTSSLHYQAVDLNIEGHDLVVIDTTVSHTHGTNQYNRRREECERALERINEAVGSGGLESLSGLKASQLEDLKGILPETLYDRTYHVVTENERVVDTADFLSTGETEEVGKLFYSSHYSLKDRYEVSAPELDFLVDFARNYPIPGARMTGGGFGGSTIHLVDQDEVDEYIEAAVLAFEGEFDVTPRSFVVEASDGAKAKPTL
ncbi:MAG: galactokinase [Candidatus Bipolaricaulota bacterium]